MKTISRVLRNVPVLMAAMVMAGAAGWMPGAGFFGTGFPGAASPAFAAEEAAPPGLPDIPADLTPEQIEAGKKLLDTSAEARKMLEDRKKQAETAKDLQKKGDKKEIEATKQEQMTKVEPKSGFPAYDWKTSTYVGNLFLKRLTDNEAKTIIHFGHEIFNPTPGAALILENMPVGPGYIVGPGDEIVIRMWGRVEGTQRVVVDRDGKIYLSKFGSLYVAGKTFDEMKSFLRSKISTIAEVSSDVTMGQMKGIRVSVVGEVLAPGWFNISSLHTALQALSMAGGVKDIGTLRRLRINRGGNEIQEIDLYDYLLRGDTRSDIRLIQGDAIFVPVVGKLVAISGEVRRPAIYELKDEKTLLDLIRVSGGFAPTAYKRRVQVERLEGHNAKIVLDADADELEKGKGPFELSDGDLVRVLPILGPERNAVILEGNVLRPGKYELKPGMTVGTLLPDTSAFLPETYFDYAQLTRLVPPDMRKETIPVNLREIVLAKKKEADVPLQGMDILTVFPRSAFRDSPKVTISGEVRKAGSFDLKKGARISDLVKLAGDLTRSASTGRSEILRIDEKRKFQTIYFDLAKAMSGDAANDLVLEDEDQVKIHSIWETRYRKNVYVAGDVNSPGEYVLAEGMKISDLLFRAGGFKESAYGREAELIRREVAPGGELVKTETIVFSPEKAMSGDKSFDIPLREYDLLVVRQIPDWAEKVQVTLSGEVRFPGSYAVRKGERLSSVIERAGGYTENAYLKGAQFTRVSTQKVQQEAIDKLIEELELESARKAQAAVPLDPKDLDAQKEQANARRALIEQLRKVKAKGRIIIRLAGAEKMKGSGTDVLLENGDRLEVPKKQNVVNVLGRVYNPTGIVYDPASDRLGHYLNLAGGPVENADRDHIFMLKADGSVVTQENVGGGFFMFGESGLMSARVEPGDSIMVPEKLTEYHLMKDFKDFIQIIYQIAITTGVLFRLL